MTAATDSSFKSNNQPKTTLTLHHKRKNFQQDLTNYSTIV